MLVPQTSQCPFTRLPLVCLHLLCWGAQTCTHHSRCGLTRTEQSGMVTSFNLPARLFLMHSRVLFIIFTILQNKSYICFLLAHRNSSQSALLSKIIWGGLAMTSNSLNTHGCICQISWTFVCVQFV